MQFLRANLEYDCGWPTCEKHIALYEIFRNSTAVSDETRNQNHQVATSRPAHGVIKVSALVDNRAAREMLHLLQ